MSWIFNAALAANGVSPSAWSWLAPLLTIPNAIGVVSGTLGLVFLYFAGSKAQREAIAKQTEASFSSLTRGINAATERADAEEKRADAATLRADAAEKREAAEKARADAAEAEAAGQAARADAEKMRADAQTARAAAFEIKNAELLNSSTEDATRFLVNVKRVEKLNAEIAAQLAAAEARVHEK